MFGFVKRKCHVAVTSCIFKPGMGKPGSEVELSHQIVEIQRVLFRNDSKIHLMSYLKDCTLPMF